MAKPICPMLQKACIEEKCAAWITDACEVEGKPTVKSGCMEFYWKPLYFRALIARTDGTQIGVEKLRGEFHNGNEAMGLLLSQRQNLQLPKG